MPELDLLKQIQNGQTSDSTVTFYMVAFSPKFIPIYDDIIGVLLDDGAPYSGID